MTLRITPESFPREAWPQHTATKRSGFWRMVRGLSLFLVSGIIYYLVVVYYLLPFPLVLPGNLAIQFMLFVGGFILAMYLTILVYEGGQLLIGVLVGYRATLLQVGAFALVRTSNGWRLRRISRDLLLFAGLHMVGPLTRKHLRLRYFLYAIGSLLLFVALPLLLLAFAYHWGMNQPPQWLALLFDLLLMTTSYGLYCNLPMLWRKLSFALFDTPFNAAMLRLQWLGLTPVQEVDPQEFDQLCAWASGTPLAADATLTAWGQAALREDWPRATQLLETALTQLPHCDSPTARICAFLAAAEHEISRGVGITQARAWLDLCKIDTTDLLIHNLMQSYRATEAKILLAEGRFGAAKAAAQASLHLLDGVAYSTNHIRTRQALEALLKSIPFGASDSDDALSNPLPLWKQRIHPLASIYSWASFAFIYFLLLKFNLLLAGQAFYYQTIGDLYLRWGQDEQAIISYNRAVELTPKGFTGPLTGRAQLHVGRGDYTLALQDLTAAIEQGYFITASDYIQRGAVYYQAGQPARAAADFATALALAEQRNQIDRTRHAIFRVYADYGVAQYEALDYAAAIEAFDRAVAVEVSNSMVYVYRGAAHAWLDNYELALADYSDALHYATGGRVRILHDRAAIYLRLGRYEAAIADYTHAIMESKTPDAKLYTMRGYTWLVLRNYPAAIADFERAMAASPGEAWPYYYRGLAYAAQHRFTASHADFAYLLTADTSGQMQQIAELASGLLTWGRHSTEQAITGLLQQVPTYQAQLAAALP